MTDWDKVTQDCKNGKHVYMLRACPFEGRQCIYCNKLKGDAFVMHND